MRPSTRLSVTLASLALPLLAASEAHAYIDLGAGSYVIQVALASVLGVAFAVKAYWARIRGLFGHRRDQDADGTPVDGADRR